jgi:hypothetical protein
MVSPSLALASVVKFRGNAAFERRTVQQEIDMRLENASHLRRPGVGEPPFPSLGRVAPIGEVFRWVPTFWDY